MEMDKFKRRLVRSVSHILKQDREQQEIAWEQMRKETGCDCKLLWERMKALTIKKLKRLVAADDRSENIAAVARLSATDWLLFDLVLVHEKLDVLGRDQIGKGKGQTMRPPMIELFDLVLEYDIEKKSGKKLLEAWAALTREYNSNGRRCSPMLLQKRWFQLKENTRANFYKLWNNYRGNEKKWEVPSLCKPTPLQAEIAKTFPELITQPFPEWKELIQMRKVILLEQFETLSRTKNRSKAVDDKPDLVVIEPVIETIDLGAESDGESPSTSAVEPTCSKVNPALVKQEPVDDCHLVNEEPVEDGLSHVQILETTHIPPELNEDSNSQSSLALEEANRGNITEMAKLMKTTTLKADIVKESVVQQETAVVEDIDLPDDLIRQKADEFIRSKSKALGPGTKEMPLELGTTETLDVDKDDEIVDDIIKQNADDFARRVDIKKIVHDNVDEYKLPEDLTFEDDGIEFDDDGIEYNEDNDDDVTKNKLKKQVPNPFIKTEVDEEHKEITETDEGIENDKDSNKEEAPKFDLKLLMEPVVYTTKLDDMIVFKGKKFNYVQFQNVIDSVVIESKPVSKRAIKVEVEDEEEEHEGTFSQSNFNHSSKAANNNLFKNNYYCQSQLNENKDPLTKVDAYKNTDEAVNDETFMDNLHQDSNDSDEGDEQIDESLKVKPTSCLLQKPRNRCYNPIILCKNPDFNTRLKRLTAGFFSSVRNRKLLSACKPMTIDVNKAFESKLVNGILYLKTRKGDSQPVKEQIDNAQSSSVIPSAMPIQSLLSKEKKNDINDLLSSSIIDTVDLTQRSKTINLRDLSEIRRINQHLLTAQVPPMRVDSADTFKLQENVLQPVVDTKLLNDSDEPKIIDVSRSTSAPEHDFCEDLQKDTMPRSYRGKPRGAMRIRMFGPARPYVPSFVPTKPTVAPWIEPKTRPTNIDDFLITKDTLNRMISKLDGCDKFKNPKVKSKKPLWAIEKSLCEQISNPLDNIHSSSNEAAPTADAAAVNTATAAEAYDPGRRKDAPEVVVNVSAQTTKQPRNKIKSKYCFKEKNVKYERNYRTKTIEAYRQELVEEKKRQHKIKKQANALSLGHSGHSSAEDAIVLSDEDNNDATDDSNDTSKLGFDPVVPRDPPVPKLRVYYAQGDNVPVKSCAGRGAPSVYATLPTVSGMSSMQLSGAGESATQPNVAGISTTPPNLAEVSLTPPNVPASQKPRYRINVRYTNAPPDPSPPLEPPKAPAKFNPISILEQLTSRNSPIPLPVPVLALNSSPNKVNIPVSLQQSTKPTRSQIVIDASELTVAENPQDLMFYLNSKSTSSKPKDSPIFLGKNKILLTNVKFPPNLNAEDKGPVSPIRPAKVTPPPPMLSQLPPGVNLVLMPDGHLNFTLDHSVQLDEAQLLVLPKVISAVQQQINSEICVPTAEIVSLETTSEINTVVPPIVIESGAEIVSLTAEEVSQDQTTEHVQQIQNIVETDNSKEQDVQQNQDTIDIEKGNDQTGCINQADVNVNNIEESRECSKNTNSSDELIATKLKLTDTNSANDENRLKESEIITLDNNDDTEETNTSTAASQNTNNMNDGGASCSRNLLSDLMEMSGISLNDVPQESAEKTQVANSLVPLVATMATPPPLVQINSDPVEVVPTAVESIAVPRALLELNPITSLAELKYAYENHGLFYKLDLDTGILAPINVCVKKNSKPKPQVVHIANRPIVKSVIDLTDDGEKEIAKNISEDGIVKPIKLIKRVTYPNLLAKKINAPTKQTLTNQNTLIRSFQKRNRKQGLGKIRAEIDLVDSDEPMEEEYLEESSDADNGEKEQKRTEKISLLGTDSDDSSDDEPLFKKFMRLKQVNSSLTKEKDNSGIKKIVDPEDKDATDTVTAPTDPNAPSNVPKPTDSSTENVKENVNSDEMETSDYVTENIPDDAMEIEEHQFIPLLDENESQEEDCILGV